MTLPTVCVAICTFNRPRQLQALLDGLVAQTFPQSFPVVIVDNGTVPAADVAHPFADRLDLIVESFPRAGLVAGRNRAIRLALDRGCDFLAFIDDDEVPVPEWLDALMRRQTETDADLVFGPVLASYRCTPPNWVMQGGFFERWGDTPGSGNALIRLSRLPADERDWFLPAFAETGGEDAEFFDRLIAAGARASIAPAAVAYEDTPPHRTTMRFVWRRGLRDGVVMAKLISLAERTRSAKLAAGARQAAAKLGYALNHFFWAAFAPWRAVRGLADIGSVLGLVLFASGRRFQFYGQKPRPKRGTG